MYDLGCRVSVLVFISTQLRIGAGRWAMGFLRLGGVQAILEPQ